MNQNKPNNKPTLLENLVVVAFVACSAAFASMTILKLLGAITFSWWWVVLPGGVAFGLVIASLLAAFSGEFDCACDEQAGRDDE